MGKIISSSGRRLSVNDASTSGRAVGDLERNSCKDFPGQEWYDPERESEMGKMSTGQCGDRISSRDMDKWEGILDIGLPISSIERDENASSGRGFGIVL